MRTADDKNSVAVIAVGAVSTSLAIFAVLARLMARVLVIHNSGIDEIAISLSMIGSIVVTFAVFFEVKYGLGKHISALSPKDIEHQLLSLWVSILAYNLSLTLTKLSIVLQYTRLFPNKRMQHICYLTMVLTALYLVVSFSFVISECSPVSAFWTGRGTCTSKSVGWIVNSVYSIFMDLAILVLPMPALAKLNLATTQKMALMFVFALGGFVTVVSCLRVKSLLITSHSKDISYDNASTAIWSMVEINFAIICACMPTFKPLVNKCFPVTPKTHSSEPTTVPRRYPQHIIAVDSLHQLPMGTLPASRFYHATNYKNGLIGGRSVDEEIGGCRQEGAWRCITVTTEFDLNSERRSHLERGHRREVTTPHGPGWI